MKIFAVIPARYQSSRFPGKPLADICGKPMIRYVYETVTNIEAISDTYVATDDERIYNAVSDFGGKVVMTGKCACGTERVAQACSDIECDVVLNMQGDEPLIKPEMICDLISAFDDTFVNMATLKKRITSRDNIENPNIVKLITDVNNNAIYFSRSAIPYNRDGLETVKYYRHIGVYGYKKEFLMKYTQLPRSPLECAEELEPLRALENGYSIRVVETECESIGVDTPNDLDRVRRIIMQNNMQFTLTRGVIRLLVKLHASVASNFIIGGIAA